MPPRPNFEPLLEGATNKCFRVSFGVAGEAEAKRKNGKTRKKVTYWVEERVEAMRAEAQEGVENVEHWLKTGKPKRTSSINGKSHYGLEIEGDEHSKERFAFMRVQGAGSVLSNKREQEMALFQIASREGLGPRLYAVFKNGYVAEFAQGRVVRAEEMRISDSPIQRAVCLAVARWHSLEAPSELHAPSLIPWFFKPKRERSSSLEKSTTNSSASHAQRSRTNPASPKTPLDSITESISEALPNSLTSSKRTLYLTANVWSMMDAWLRRAKRLYADEDAELLAKGWTPPQKTVNRRRRGSKNVEDFNSSQSDSNDSESSYSSSSGASPTFSEFLARVEATQRDLLPFYALKHATNVLCHNDLNHGNLLWNASRGEVWAVDLEFAGVNHRGFDLANHFCEWASLELHYHHCPNDEQMRIWINCYLDYLGPEKGGFCVCSECSACRHCTYCNKTTIDHDTSRNSSSRRTRSQRRREEASKREEEENLSGSAHSDDEEHSFADEEREEPQPFYMVHVSKHQVIEEMIVECRKWMQVSHLFWWLWGMIQVKISNIEGFDARRYAKVRWDEYSKAEEATKALKTPSRLLKHAPAFRETFPHSSLSPQFKHHKSHQD